MSRPASRGELPLAALAAEDAADTARMRDETVTDLLERLSSGRFDAAWSEFLARYSPLIVRAIRRHETDPDCVGECFVYVCGTSSDAGLRRLRSYRPDGPARLSTGLMAVVANLCVTNPARRPECRTRPTRIGGDAWLTARFGHVDSTNVRITSTTWPTG